MLYFYRSTYYNKRDIEGKEAYAMHNEEVTKEEELKTAIEEVTAPMESAKALSKKQKTILGVILAVLATLLIGYLLTTWYYKDRFFMRTSLNYVDCSNMTIEEVEAHLKEQVEQYELQLIRSNGKTETIKGADINLTYKGYEHIEESLEKQNPFLWPKALFSSRRIQVYFVLEYNQEVVTMLLRQLDCMQEKNQKDPIPATVIYKNGTFVVQEETYGTTMDERKLLQMVNQRMHELRKDLDLTKTKCYVQPRFLKESKKVLEAKDQMNQCLNAEIIYSLESMEVVLNRDDFATWITVDEEMNPVIQEDKIREYIQVLSDTYNTPNRYGELTTPNGKTVSVANAALGRVVGVDAEIKKITEDIMAGKRIEREPIIARWETPEGEYVWGNTYIEVDISQQHMWYVVDNVVKLETPVVTGLKGKDDTPTGIYNILEKKRNKTLVGRIVNGKPLYRTPVSYWMRATWSGVGFHDANWQPTFGGDRYLTNGSHGCINMPPTKAKQLYNMLSIGTPIVIHY